MRRQAGDRWWPWKCQPCGFYTFGEEAGWGPLVALEVPALCLLHLW